MVIEIPYGTGRQTLQIPRERLCACITPRSRNTEQIDEGALVREALLHPIGSKRLGELAQGKNRVVVITSDHTRPLPSRITLPLYLEEIRRGNPSADITLLIATGLHRAPTADEMRAKFGDVLLSREKFLVHDAGDAGAMAFFGLLPSGGELWLNRLIREADLVVSEGFIEPHFFAGFSGGRKSILPGVAGKKTVLYNHNAGFIQHPLARQGSLEGNPVHEDMAFAAQAAGLAFILNVLLDEEKRIVAAFAGDAQTAHAAGCRLCEERTRVPGARADIVVTSNGGYPLDQNLYQAVKGLTAAEACVRPGGAIVMCAALQDGHGGEAFFHFFADREDAREVTRDIEHVPPEQTRADQWQAQILARVQQKATCFFVTGAENRRTVEAMHMRWAGSLQEALDAAGRLLREGASDTDMSVADVSVAVIPDGVGVIVSDPA